MKMEGLIYRDVTVLYEQYLKRPVILCAICSIVAMFVKKFEALSAISMMPAMLVFAAFSLFFEDEKDNWEKFLRTLPIKPAKIVWSRMSLFFALAGVGTVFSFVIGVLTFAFFREQTFAEYLKIPFVGLLVAVIMILLAYPLCHALGELGGQISSLLFYIVIVAVSILYQAGIVNFGAIVSANSVVFWCSAAAVLTILPIISFYLSVFFFNRRKIH